MKDLEAKIIIPPTSIKDAEAVRIKVFQQEQGIARDLDFDGNDQSSIHVVAYKNGAPIGTGRVRLLENGVAKIERVAVLSQERGQGIGKLLMESIDDYLGGVDIKEAVLDAQLHAKSFYERLGYIQKGKIFEEVGIPHVVMVKRFNK